MKIKVKDPSSTHGDSQQERKIVKSKQSPNGNQNLNLGEIQENIGQYKMDKE